MKRALILAIAASFGVSAFAAPETYVFDPNHTYPSFSYAHMGFSTQQSKFDKTTGTVTVDRAAKTGSLDVNVDTKSINTGFDVFNGHLKGEDFFNVEKFPSITFKSNTFKFEGDKVAAISGDLTIKGVTKPVTLTVTAFNCAPHPFTKKPMCGANASTTIKRSEFNAGKYVPAVSDEVTLNIVVEAVKE
jgi:polyisoprenoid-binding protein YceI